MFKRKLEEEPPVDGHLPLLPGQDVDTMTVTPHIKVFCYELIKGQRTKYQSNIPEWMKFLIRKKQ